MRIKKILYKEMQDKLRVAALQIWVATIVLPRLRSGCNKKPGTPLHTH
jgi:prophage antirepressor-like protein